MIEEFKFREVYDSLLHYDLEKIWEAVAKIYREKCFGRVISENWLKSANSIRCEMLKRKYSVMLTASDVELIKRKENKLSKLFSTANYCIEEIMIF